MKRATLIAVLLLASPAAFACAICVSKPLKYAFQDAEVFFVGIVTNRAPGSVTFEVVEQFQGAPATEVTLSTSSSCSLSDFSLGETYLVEAIRDEPGASLRADLCSHTYPLSRAAPTLEVVRSRSRWWHTRLSRLSWYRFREFLSRRLD